MSLSRVTSELSKLIVLQQISEARFKYIKAGRPDSTRLMGSCSRYPGTFCGLSRDKRSRPSCLGNLHACNPWEHGIPREVIWSRRITCCRDYPTYTRRFDMRMSVPNFERMLLPMLRVLSLRNRRRQARVGPDESLHF
jgi:hypothetical protein